MFGAIVVGTDGSDTATKAVSAAADVARRHDASLHVVSAFAPVSRQRLRDEGRQAPHDHEWTVNPREDVDATLGEVMELTDGMGVDVRTYAREGDPADAILDVAEE